ncbi:hypothetical protein J7I80_19065 [Bacillus sp. ISL-41]|uniref:hypothetical protein n=1 Tax=Bacillus sp. ISL-41 TaxID=2819127 RepID=UPI001BEB74C0|nr:hypothetical protein [Bacillus sp. ISL-41]MBT2644349.1 hypothetical protein [Bacillus sp. ISL-41]
MNKWFLVFMLLTSVLWGCEKSEAGYTDRGDHLPEKLNTAISNFVIDEYADIYDDKDQLFEVHKVYGTHEENGKMTVYLYSYMVGMKKGSEPSGHIVPAVIKLKKEAEGYTFISYKEPEDGTRYQSSLEKIFPDRYLESVREDTGNLDALMEEMEKKVELWVNEGQN